MSAGEPTLGGIRPAEKRAFAWAGAFVLFVALGPVEREAAMGLVWPPDLFDDGPFRIAWPVLLASGATLLTVGRSNLSRLTSGTLALTLIAVALGASLLARPLVSGFVTLLPLSMQETAPLFLLAVGLTAAATRWRTGIEGLMRSTFVARALCAAAGLIALLGWWWPATGGSVAQLWSDALIAALSPDVTLDHRRAAGTQLVTASLPILLTAYGAWRSLRRAGTGPSATGWVLALAPAVLLTLGLKGAATFGDDGYVLLGARSAALFLAATMTIAFAVSGILEQLHDPLGADCHHPTHLLRDELLYEALLDADDDVPNFARATEGYRTIVRRLVRERFATLFGEVAQEHSHLAPYAVVRDDVLRLLWGDVSRPPSPDAPLPHPPRASNVARWLARGRRIEGVVAAGIIGIAVTATTTRHVTRPRAEPWHLGANATWALTLYRDHLPRIAVAAGQSTPDDHQLLDDITARAVASIDGYPELAAAVTRLGDAASDVYGQRHALQRAGESINIAAREAGLPYYLDVNVFGRQRRSEWVFYLKTYRIRRTRVARVNDTSFAALWVDRLDRTNVVERQLGWTKRDQPRGMVILDVVRDYWRDDLAPVLAGTDATPIARIYRDYGDLLHADLARAMEAYGADQAFETLVACIAEGTIAYEGGWRAEPVEMLAQRVESGRVAEREDPAVTCEAMRRRVEPALVEVLARKVEVHEVQHVVDGRELEAPRALRAAMTGYSEQAIGFAAAELSAYLAEVAHSNLPRLALVHFLAISGQRAHTPEAFAGQVAQAAIEEDVPLSTLLMSSDEELRAAADRAYARLFGRTRIVFDLSDLPVGP